MTPHAALNRARSNFDALHPRSVEERQYDQAVNEAYIDAMGGAAATRARPDEGRLPIIPAAEAEEIPIVTPEAWEAAAPGTPFRVPDPNNPGQYRVVQKPVQAEPAAEWDFGDPEVGTVNQYTDMVR